MDSSSFSLMTSLAYQPPSGWHLLPRHLERLRTAHSAFASSSSSSWCTTTPYPGDNAIVEELEKCVAAGGSEKAQRVRLILEEDGGVKASSAPLDSMPSYPVRLVWDSEPIDYDTLFTKYKTTKREMYDSARARCGATLKASPDPKDPPFDVLLFNHEGEVTETTISNCAFCFDPTSSTPFVTPPSASGLLPGVQRRDLLEKGTIVEGVVRKDDVQRAAEAKTLEIICFNAVRGVFRATLV